MLARSAAVQRPALAAWCPQQRLAAPVVVSRPGQASRRPTVAARAERSSDSSFLAGFVMGGVVFGALGFLLAPQISKALLSDDARLRLPRFMEEGDAAPRDPEATKQDLIDRIAQLNASIDEVASQLRGKEEEGGGASGGGGGAAAGNGAVGDAVTVEATAAPLG